MGLNILEEQPSVTTDELSQNAMGGTEIMKYGLASRLNKKLADKFNIICSRVREVSEDKHNILWLHDLPNDPESAKIDDPEWRKQFDKIVCVSEWQMQQYNLYKRLPYGDSVVLKNAIDPLPNVEKDFSGPIKLIYHSTPHRGLEILYPVFDELSKKHENIQLDVYSSFNLYGWPSRDEPYKELFKRLEDHPKINYHGSADNETVRKALTEAHIFAYPSIWPETSCLCLMEAMSASLLCVHPNYAALPETAGQFTMMYQWDEDINRHASTFYQYLDVAIQSVQRSDIRQMIDNQKMYADMFYNWGGRVKQWEGMLEQILAYSAKS